jgi:hypothetical protein
MSSIGKTIMAAHAEGRHFNTTTTTTKDFKMTTTTTTGKLTSVSSSSYFSDNSSSLSSSSSSSPSSSYLSITFGDNDASQLSSSSSSPSSPPSSLPTIRLECCWIVMFLGILRFCFLLQKRRFEIQLRKQEQPQRQIRTIQNFYYRPLKTFRSHEGPKQKRWQALVHWDPHLFPPTHGYHLLKDRQGFHRFVKAVNLLPSNKPRQFPRKLRYASTVQVKLIPHKSDPINADAWNRQFHRQVAENSRWQQQQWHLEAAGKNKHRRLVVSEIAMKEFRKTVLPMLIDHANELRMRRSFRQMVAPQLIDHAHRLRWKWALQHHHTKAKFQQAVLGFLASHCQMLRLKWDVKASFRRTVVASLVDHSHRKRWQWALQHEARKHFGRTVVDAVVEHGHNLRISWRRQIFRRVVVTTMADHSHRVRWKWALQHHHTKANFQQAVLGSLASHCQSLRKKWEFKTFFRRSHRSHDEESDGRTNCNNYDGETDSDNSDGDDINNNNVDPNDVNATVHTEDYDDIDADANSANDDDDDDDPAPAPTPTPPTTRPRQRRAGSATGGATVWVDGLRRSARLRPTFGSIYENGRRRSARFL